MENFQVHCPIPWEKFHGNGIPMNNSLCINDMSKKLYNRHVLVDGIY